MISFYRKIDPTGSDETGGGEPLELLLRMAIELRVAANLLFYECLRPAVAHQEEELSKVRGAFLKLRV